MSKAAGLDGVVDREPVAQEEYLSHARASCAAGSTCGVREEHGTAARPGKDADTSEGTLSVTVTPGHGGEKLAPGYVRASS